ncbi:type IV secretion system DNA-binding domain-containing protein [Candidatus Kaiserbacteria bacterium]|nr:type IV secretion system DNA-binding domain-containing protein [Candidatus Kaiserbacteria bacterium]MCB9812578.1 type IV secretion system DNA-binding domain-containing protein [Candidatus Nomurabacteria bacterium]
MTTFDPDKITFFAKTDARGKEVSFGIKAKDRQRHMYVVGKTGMGKSTLLENMAAQDIINGEGMAFIDPHGSAAETLLNYVPEHRIKDVVYFAPFDLDHPISFNVMEDVGPDKRHLVVSGLMSTFKKIWVDAWSARMEYILTNALLALIEYPDTTLLSVNRLFVDKEFRERVVDYIKDPAVKAFWVDEFANYTDRFTAEALPAIQNKIGQFTGNPLIRNIIGQPHSSFNIRELMDNQKILIMNLSKGLIGETNANLLGSMLTTRIYLAAMSRADLPVEKMKLMPNFYFYVDEFQSFANATFANILSEARKYHLNLIIAHQYIEQMEEDVRNAVFGNVGTTIAFRVGPFDAEVLETVFAPRFEATDLVNLGFAQIYLTLMIDGIGSQPFSAKTLPPVQLPAVSCRDMVLAASRQLYAKERLGVEKLVADLHMPERKEAPKRSFDKRSNNNSFKPKHGQPGSGKDGNGRSEQGSFKRAEREERNGRNGERDSRPKPPPQKTPEDLRAVLAKLAQKDTSVPEQPPLPSSTSNSEPVTPNDQPKNAAPARQENNQLKNALAEALQKVTAAPAKPAEAPTQKPAPAAPSANPVGEPRRQTQSFTAPPSTGPDVAEVKKILRQNESDRTPFN